MKLGKQILVLALGFFSMLPLVNAQPPAEIQRINQSQKSEVKSIRAKYNSQIEKTSNEEEKKKLRKERRKAVLATREKHEAQRKAIRAKNKK